MYNYLWPKARQTQAMQTQAQQTQARQTHAMQTHAMQTQAQQTHKPVKKETCDLCFLKRPINKWYSDDFFICTKCASCEHCNKLDDKIKCELDINEITQICKSCNK